MKPLPIGIEDFSEFKKNDYYYVDKTLFIKELLDKKGKANLFTRPRRFGKTLTLSMLRYYFEEGSDPALFEGRKIMQAGEEYLSYMGQFPVITLTLKSMKQDKEANSLNQLREILASEFKRHRQILQSDLLLPSDKDRYEDLMNRRLDVDEYRNALKFLCDCIREASGKKVILLIDEYDVPLEHAYYHGYYDHMVDYIRSLFEGALKTNDSLEFAVITGCLRISKESIFTGLNNMEINSVLSDNYGEYFGFTENEVEHMLSAYDQRSKFDEVKTWYNGYTFGNTNIYNPWSTIRYVKDHISNRKLYPISYWANTSSNSIIKDLIKRADAPVKAEIESLIQGGSIEKPIHEDITYGEIYDSQDNLWNFLFFTGYLKKTSERFDESTQSRYLSMIIPNHEVEYIYREKVLSWFQERVRLADRTRLFDTMLHGDAEGFEQEINRILLPTISFYDFYENFYHGFLAGILTGSDTFIVKSNRESGEGRSDLFVKHLDPEEAGIVIEMKIASNVKEMDRKAEEALQQIRDRGYDQELMEEGYLTTIHYGIAFFKKKCRVHCSVSHS